MPRAESHDERRQHHDAIDVGALPACISQLHRHRSGYALDVLVPAPANIYVIRTLQFAPVFGCNAFMFLGAGTTR
jgi:hypothetical protein